jgi:hypothetical protein
LTCMIIIPAISITCLQAQRAKSRGTSARAWHTHSQCTSSNFSWVSTLTFLCAKTYQGTISRYQNLMWSSDLEVNFSCPTKSTTGSNGNPIPISRSLCSYRWHNWVGWVSLACGSIFHHPGVPPLQVFTVKGQFAAIDHNILYNIWMFAAGG